MLVFFASLNAEFRAIIAFVGCIMLTATIFDFASSETRKVDLVRSHIGVFSILALLGYFLRSSFRILHTPFTVEMKNYFFGPESEVKDEI
jgi:hypothetical protein